MDPSLIRDSRFPAPDRDNWRKIAEKALKGASLEECLVSTSDDSIRIDPVFDRYTESRGLRRNANGNQWITVQRIDDPDPARANRQALEDVENGATGLAVVFAGAPNAFGYGLPSDKKSMARALDGISFDRTHVRVDVHPNYRGSADWIVEYLGSRRVNPKKLSICFGIDPAARFAGTGQLRVSIEALLASMPQSMAGFFALGVPGVLMEADGRVYHNAGATEGQELGAMIATAVSHMRMFENARQPLVYSAPHIGFALSVDQDEFMSIAKIRALRLLWRRVQQECSIDPSPAMVHAETSFSMISKKDPETNILRSTIAAFSAAAGGADSISVLPHTIGHGLPDAFARRIARNTQLILADEAGIANVVDPAAGAGGIEYLTSALCEKGWEHFRQIENEGGILASLREGKLQSRIAAMLKARRDAVASGKHPILGTTLYPADAERPVSTLDAAPQVYVEDAQASCEPLPPVRSDTLLEAGT
jgi:methylmalonyl-CoA mutase